MVYDAGYDKCCIYDNNCWPLCGVCVKWEEQGRYIISILVALITGLAWYARWPRYVLLLRCYNSGNNIPQQLPPGNTSGWTLIHYKSFSFSFSSTSQSSPRMIGISVEISSGIGWDLQWRRKRWEATARSLKVTVKTIRDIRDYTMPPLWY